MLKLKKVALTGGVASGKSAAAKRFKELGAYVVVADDIVHNLLSPDTEVGKKVIELLGDSIVVNNKIDRTRIAKKVFTHPKLIKQLENIIHPAVYEEVKVRYEKVQNNKKYPLFVAEIPLLYETKNEDWFDTVIVVFSKIEESWKRFREDTGYERDEFDIRMSRQLSPFEKEKRADIVIYNDKGLDELKEQVTNIYYQLTSEA